ncbi:hypothetical protein BKA62DRAFT_728027 [Auriculariales sp. MPI-PUGE-AT-0066]|nr:hypothetical protein BKA62DRAFT_728027 [Auriculariales sp. MPI-PUGE-AT-0066]
MNTTSCKDQSVTWYDNQDGLNPCQQYSELRKLCDTSYEVPDMNGQWPPDTCRSQKNECCCNSVAFSLSMLCIQCQMGVGTGKSQDSINAREDGVYQLFLAGCGPGTNHSLPTSVQTAVCQSGLKLMRYQYDPFWDNGQWWLEYTRQVALEQISKGTLDPGLCSTSSSTTPLHPKTTTAQSSSNSSIISTSTNRPTSSITTTLPPPTTASSASNSSTVSSFTNHPDPIQGQIEASGGGSPDTALIGGSVGAAVVIVILLCLIARLLWMKRRNKENETRRRRAMAHIPATHSSDNLFNGSSNNDHTASVTPHENAPVTMTYQPLTAHERKIANIKNLGARDGVNRDRTSPFATMTHPPEYPFDELLLREPIWPPTGSHAPSEAPRTRYAPTDFDVKDVGGHGGMSNFDWVDEALVNDVGT